MPVPEFETLVVPHNSTWMTLTRTRMIFERDVLPGPSRADALVPATLGGGNRHTGDGGHSLCS